MKSVLILNLLILVSLLGGCDTQESIDIYTIKDSDEKVEAILIGENVNKNNFKNNFEVARQFTEKYREGRAYFETEKYQLALTSLESAYELADNKSAQGMALWKMAEVYEAMENYELAANFYEATAETSMNKEKSKEFLAKAKVLRQMKR